MPRTILVTGATGFTGGNLARRLAAGGESVRALVRDRAKAQSLAAEGIDVRVGQLTSLDEVIEAARGCDQIYHIAAVFRTAGHPDSYYRDVNIGGTQNVLEAARRLDCERVVHCSTGGVHGHIADPPASETYPFGPGDIYQRTKLEAELAVSAAARRGQRVAIVRPGPIYGEGDLRFLKLYRAVARGVFVMIGSGTPKLHMVHIDDLVDGIVLCGNSEAALGEVFILAGPQAPTLNEIVRHIAQSLGVAEPRWRIPVWPVMTAGLLCESICVPLHVDPPLHRRRVAFFTHHREFDCSKAVRLLGYAPKVTPGEGIARTAQWYRASGYLGNARSPSPGPSAMAQPGHASK
ncbi:MAG TPA: NAD-dependent epimerase/dehydratase family protein [Steroidobacteraceae bacterium]|jgi:nucleoside-diphosphate-sugar epimerase|nr:NAD-dependent epimerase/dehydratase family protein [Steroidobacteraceae bacterium]